MRIFYSWQSDIPKNRNLIASSLEQIHEVVGAEIESATRDTNGSPDIASTILMKIDSCNVFLADVSTINSASNSKRKTPNPNVLYELGYAMKSLGEENIILIANKDVTDTHDLPFDIRNRRMVLVSFEDKNAKKIITQAISASMIASKPKSNLPVAPKIIFIDENIEWANWGSSRGSFTGFRTILSLDNYKGESDYIVDVRLIATKEDGTIWESDRYTINDSLENKLFSVPPDSMMELTIIMNGPVTFAGQMPQLEESEGKIKVSFRSGKEETLEIPKGKIKRN